MLNGNPRILIIVVGILLDTVPLYVFRPLMNKDISLGVLGSCTNVCGLRITLVLIKSVSSLCIFVLGSYRLH